LTTYYSPQDFLNENGEIQKEVMFAKIGHGQDDEFKAKLSKLIEKCTSLKGENLCSTAFKIHNCYYSHL
jgi:PBP/GOBP family